MQTLKQMWRALWQKELARRESIGFGLATVIAMALGIALKVYVLPPTSEHGGKNANINEPHRPRAALPISWTQRHELSAWGISRLCTGPRLAARSV